MKSLQEYLRSMYFWAVTLLLLCAAVSSYALRVFPANLLAAIAACLLLDETIKGLLLKKGFKFSASAAITGIIIGSVAPLNAPVAAILAASAVAIISKYVIRIKGMHIFNPATLGLLVSLFAFRLGDMWWAAAAGISVLGFAVPLTLTLIVANYKADKLKVAILFLLATALLYAATGFVRVPFTASGILTFAGTMPYYFAFIMLSEPKTSPYEPGQQVIFGMAVAVVYFLLDFSHARFPFFIALLAGNLAYSLHRSGFFTQKKQQ